MCMCESHIVFVHCICSLLYMPLTQILGIAVQYNKFYSILFYSIRVVTLLREYVTSLTTSVTTM